MREFGVLRLAFDVWRWTFGVWRFRFKEFQVSGVSGLQEKSISALVSRNVKHEMWNVEHRTLNFTNYRFRLCIF